MSEGGAALLLYVEQEAAALAAQKLSKQRGRLGVEWQTGLRLSNGRGARRGARGRRARGGIGRLAGGRLRIVGRAAGAVGLTDATAVMVVMMVCPLGLPCGVSSSLLGGLLLYAPADQCHSAGAPD